MPSLAGWEALNERQTGLLLEQRKEIELAEAGNSFRRTHTYTHISHIHHGASLFRPEVSSVFGGNSQNKRALKLLLFPPLLATHTLTHYCLILYFLRHSEQCSIPPWHRHSQLVDRTCQLTHTLRVPGSGSVEEAENDNTASAPQQRPLQNLGILVRDPLATRC